MPCMDCKDPSRCTSICEIYASASGPSGPVSTCGAHRAGRPAPDGPLRGPRAGSACGAPRSVSGDGAPLLEEAMRLHDEAAEARRIFGKGQGYVTRAEANRSRQTRAALRDFLAQHLDGGTRK